MNGRHIFTFAIIVVAFVAYADAICCLKGAGRFCKDCRHAGVLGCCGAGSGKGNGCNVFCCNCGGGKCRTGRATITHRSGWWFHKKYSCTLNGDETEDEAADDTEDIVMTRNVFNGLDTNKDNSLSPDEFVEGLRQRMNPDLESSYSLASDLLKDNNEESVISLMDVARIDENLDEENLAQDVGSMIRREFLKMDTNSDGIIQAKEFDEDL